MDQMAKLDMGDNLSVKYKQIWFNKFSFPNNVLLNSLKFGEIVVSMDTLFNQDTKPLTIPLNRFWNISLISIYSSILSSEEIDLINVSNLNEKQEKKLKKTIAQIKGFKKKKRNGGLNKSNTQSKLSKKSKKGADLATEMDGLLSCDPLENHDIFAAVGKNLSVTRSLRYLQFWALRLSKKSWQCIGESLGTNNTVKILSINACGVDSSAFEALVPALDKNTSMEILDLSYNFMGDDMACYIAKIIANQSERRDNVVWLAGLRGEAPQGDEYKAGLQSLILRYNDFGDFVWAELSRVLLYDVYIKSVDLRNNKIGEKGIKDMCNFLKSNKILLNCDLRDNIGFIGKLHRNIVIKLLRNLKLAKEDPRIDEQKWINSDLLMVEVPEYLIEKIQNKIGKVTSWELP